MRVLPYGAQALLIEPDHPDQVLAYAAALSADADVIEVVPAARTVLVRAPAAALPGLRTRLADLRPAPASLSEAGREVVLDVIYDGVDLGSVARASGLEPDEVVGLHTAGDYVVAFCGFAPGFAYLTGLDARLHRSRLDEPRTRVPAGSVGIAGEFTGVYPRSSPGGWRLLGRTDARLWDAERVRPALLVAGTRVRFRAAQ